MKEDQAGANNPGLSGGTWEPESHGLPTPGPTKRRLPVRTGLWEVAVKVSGNPNRASSHLSSHSLWLQSTTTSLHVHTRAWRVIHCWYTLSENHCGISFE